ncbi:hypothetical protein JHK85_006496 [Glycine max]|nr:hypothetical protein JHK85_006496 [Glycine max]
MCTFEKKKHENVNGTHHEDNENEKDLMYEELKELTLGHESPYLSMSCDVNDTPDENICTMENDFLNVTANSEKKEESSSPPVEHHNTIDQREAELKIQHLWDRCTMIESTLNLLLPHAENTVIASYAEQSIDPKETSFLKGNLDGESWLPTIDLYCPSQQLSSLMCFNGTTKCWILLSNFRPVDLMPLFESEQRKLGSDFSGQWN